MGEAIWKDALAAVGANWLVTVKEPVAATEASALASPFHVAVSVSDCPGCSVSCSRYCALMPEFDCQIVVPPCDTLKPSMLGPSVTVTG